MADEQRPSDFDIQSHNEEVMQESIKNQPLVGERAAISTLVEEYASATETFQRKTQVLLHHSFSSFSFSPLHHSLSLVFRFVFCRN